MLMQGKGNKRKRRKISQKGAVWLSCRRCLVNFAIFTEYGAVAEVNIILQIFPSFTEPSAIYRFSKIGCIPAVFLRFRRNAADQSDCEEKRRVYPEVFYFPPDLSDVISFRLSDSGSRGLHTDAAGSPAGARAGIRHGPFKIQ